VVRGFSLSILFECITSCLTGLLRATGDSGVRTRLSEGDKRIGGSLCNLGMVWFWVGAAFEPGFALCRVVFLTGEEGTALKKDSCSSVRRIFIKSFSSVVGFAGGGIADVGRRELNVIT